MTSVANLPAGLGASLSEGPEEALLIRHGDTVHVLRAGDASPYLLHFYDKEARLKAGSAVFTDAGGFAELVFPQGSRAQILGAGALALGSPSRGEPLLLVLEVDRLTLSLGPSEVVRLPGGARLQGAGGPYHIERLGSDLLEIRNRSRADLEVSMRDGTSQLSPGDVLHLPILTSGGTPFTQDPDLVAQGRIGPLPVFVSANNHRAQQGQGRLGLVLDAGQAAQALGLEIRADREMSFALGSLASYAGQP